MENSSEIKEITNKSEPNDGKENMVSTLSREEIVQLRRERKKLKKQEMRKIKEQNAIEQSRTKQSEKVQIISAKNYQQIRSLEQSSTTVPKMIKNKRYIPVNFNLLNFIIEKRKTKQPIRQIANNPFKIKLKRGKRRENPKKSLTRLKKIIMKNRIEKQHHKESESDINTVTKYLENLEIKPKNKYVHSRKFQPYCDNLTSSNLCMLTEKLIREIFRFQKRAYEKNPIKGSANRRFVVGFKETKLQLELNKLKLIVIAPDCESCPLPDGINEIIENIKISCREKSVGYLFSLRRRQLGYVLFKKVPINCLGIISYDGAQDIFHELIKQLHEDKVNYAKEFKLETNS